MKLYKWSGHTDQAVAILANFPNTPLVFLMNGEEAVLLYESEGAGSLPYTEAYEVLDASGAINGGYFAVFNNIPVAEEGRELFEERFKKRAGLIEKEPGFAAIRVLRPVTTDTYVVLTLWEDEKSFTDWQQSRAYGQAHAKRGTAEGIDRKRDIFPRPSFVQTYIK
ncbi:antibiotic biosynthesis monooxygenase family protein [Planococcus salinus]|uniref:Antibiotic biosynthesis monooxygenase n=1 Tax=Planococcus salinus TaxID=1848460 RepID=A0A3M8P9Z3_9BACL|nr:antibiotic biosynthesis monooxygenase [Planococcus salinus]RNF40060.1 antibiotic biosynthesis monooxygenase [Planococcus salinus]